MSPAEDASPEPVRAHNRRAWDAMVERRERFTKAAKDEEFAAPLKTIDGLGWLGPSITGWRVLCLAAGGGRQGPLYAAAGGLVTVVDISPAMLAIDRQVAAERGLEIHTVEASMDALDALAAASFDLVVHPVSTCYVPNIAAVFAEVARVLRPAGLYISQHKTPTSLQAEVRGTAAGYRITEPYYRTGPLPAVAGSRHREEGTLEFLHRWEEIVGGICRAGFVIEDLVEPQHAKDDAEPGSFSHRSRYVAPYARIKARRRTASHAGRQAASAVWTPDS